MRLDGKTYARLLRLLPTGAAALIAYERRINFCLQGMRARAPAAEFFEVAVRERVYI